MSLSCRQGKAFWGSGQKAKPTAPLRSPAAILERRRLGGCLGNGAARAVRSRLAPAAGPGPAHKGSAASSCPARAHLLTGFLWFSRSKPFH